MVTDPFNPNPSRLDEFAEADLVKIPVVLKDALIKYLERLDESEASRLAKVLREC